MRLQTILLLAAATVLVSVDASATTDLKTTQARSLAVEGNNAAPKRLLRADTTAAEDDEEERLSWGGLKKLFGSDTTTKVSSKIATSKVAPLIVQKVSAVDDKVDDVLKGMSLEKAFTHLGLDKIAKVDKVDDFFTSPKLNQWIGHMADTNRHASSKKDAMTIAKFLVSQRGDDEVVKLLSAARASDNQAVKKLGYKLQFDQFKLWIKAGKEPSQLRKEVPALSKRMRTAYRQEYENALAKAAAAAEKANEKVRANADITFVKP